MTRTVLTISLLLLPGWSLAAKPLNNEAQIKALKANIDKLRHEEGAALKQIDEQFKAAIGKDEKPEEREKRIRARLEREEKEAMKHIDERFNHIIHNLEPKQVHHQMEEALKTLEHIRLSIFPKGEDDLDYKGDRAAAGKSLHAAEHQLKWALEHDTGEERKKAGEAIAVAHEDVIKALHSHPIVVGSEKGTAKGAAEIAETNKRLHEDLIALDHAHHLLHAVAHEIKDFEHEKRELLKQRDEVKQKTGEEFHAKIDNMGKEIAQEEHQKKELIHQKDEAKKKLKEQYAAQIKELENQIKGLEKKK